MDNWHKFAYSIRVWSNFYSFNHLCYSVYSFLLILLLIYSFRYSFCSFLYSFTHFVAHLLILLLIWSFKLFGYWVVYIMWCIFKLFGYWVVYIYYGALGHRSYSAEKNLTQNNGQYRRLKHERMTRKCTFWNSVLILFRTRDFSGV